MILAYWMLFIHQIPTPRGQETPPTARAEVEVLRGRVFGFTFAFSSFESDRIAKKWFCKLTFDQQNLMVLDCFGNLWMFFCLNDV